MTKKSYQSTVAGEPAQYGTLAVVIDLDNIGAHYDPQTNRVIIERAIVPPSEELMMALRTIAREGSEKLADEVMDKINKIAIIEDIIENARIEV